MAEHINKALKRQGDSILASTESYVAVTPGHIQRAQQAWEKYDMKQFVSRVARNTKFNLKVNRKEFRKP